MGIKERISSAWNKLKNKFNGQNDKEETEYSVQELETELPDEAPLETMTTFVAESAETVQQEVLDAEPCYEEEVSRSAEDPEESETAGEPIPSRMTDEYKEWLQQQRKAADEANNPAQE